MDGCAPRIAVEIGVRHDGVPEYTAYTAHEFHDQLRRPGIRSTPTCVGEPGCNGVAERLIRTLKEECLYLHDF